MTPGVRVGSIAASGVAGIAVGPFTGGLVAGNTVFVAGHFGLGYLLGASAGRVIGQASTTLLGVLGAMAVLAVVGAVGWVFLTRRRRAGAGSTPAVAWTDAACPACLALAAVGRAPDRLSIDG